MFVRRCPKCNVLASRWPADPNLEGGKRCAVIDCPNWDDWPFNEEKPERRPLTSDEERLMLASLRSSSDPDPEPVG